MADGFKPRKFQFSLALLMGAVLYAGALATASINLVGKNWTPLQMGVAYFITIGCVVGFAMMSKARGKVAMYLLISPLIFVASVVAAAMFRSADSNIPVIVTTPAPTTAAAGTSTAAAPYVLPAPSPGN